MADSVDQPVIATIWRPSREASADLRDLYAQMHQVLDVIARDSKMPDILHKPGTYKAAHIYEETIRVLFSDDFLGGDNELRVAVHNLLNECLKLLDPGFRRKSAAYSPAPRNSFPAVPSQTREMVTLVADLFEDFLLGKGRKAYLHDLKPEIQVGLLLTSITLRQGQTAWRVLSALAASVNEPMRVAGEWFYRDVASGQGSSATPERRRVFMDLVTAALYQRISADCVALFEPKAKEKPAALARRRKTILRRCFSAFIEFAGANVAAYPSLGQLLKARGEMLRMQACSVICDYASGELVSSSFREDAFLRFLGYYLDTPGHVNSQDNGPKLNTLVEKENVSIAEKAVRGDFDEAGLLAELRAILGQPRKQWEIALQQCLATQTNTCSRDSAQVLLTRWIIEEAMNKGRRGKPVACGTVKNKLSALGARLLSQWPKDGFSPNVGADDLQEVYINILDTAASDGHVPRLGRILRDFDRFYRHVVRPNLADDSPDLAITGGYYEVSANALAPSEYDRLLDEICGDRSPYAAPWQQDQATLFVELAYRVGLRKSEILGLMRGDVHWARPSLIVLRDNERRDLKTGNSNRYVPVGLLSEQGRECLKRVYSNAPDQARHAPLFQTSEGAYLPDHVIIPELNKRMRWVSSGSNVHPHNLRHAAASWLFLALLGKDVRVGRYIKWAPFLGDVLELAERAEATLLNRFRPLGSRSYAMSRLLGHGSPEMTYQCYVHTLDILLYAATDSSGDHQDKQLQLASLGLSGSQRRRGKTPSEMLGPLLRRGSGRCVICQPMEPVKEVPASEAGLQLADLIDAWTKAQDNGHNKVRVSCASLGAWLNKTPPEKPAFKEAAALALDFLNTALAKDRELATAAIKLWCDSRLSGRDWASMTADQVCAFLNGLCHEKSDYERIDVCLVEQDKKKNRRKRRRISREDLDDLGSQQNRKARYWVRLRDERSASIRRRLKPGDRQRQMTQSSVTWAVFGVISVRLGF